MPTLGEIARECGRLRRSAARLPRRKTAHTSRPFDESWETEFLGGYLTASLSGFHTDLLSDLNELHRHRGTRLNYRGPRGSGKTSHISKAYPLWCALENVEPLTLLLAETGEQAKAYLRAIKAELEDNAALRAAYPHAAGVGPVWRDDRVVLRNGACIVARGTAGRVLGLTHGPHRPSLVIGDDLNSRMDAYSPTMRGRKLDWFLKDVLKVGTPATNFVVAGTSIHREAITCTLTGNPAWTTRRYSSVLRWPDRMDLWGEWERIYSNLGDENRAEKARQFYEMNSLQMEAGSVVLWPDLYPLYDLMRDRAESGPGPFASERQDEPGADGSTEFPAEWLDRPDLWFWEWPDDIQGKAYFLDPSKGRTDKPGDWQAHVWGGWSRSRSALYVEADLRREPGPQMVERSIRQAKAFGAQSVTIETNSDNVDLLFPMFKDTLAKMNVGIGFDGIHHSDPKLGRIRSLGPYLCRGQIKVRQTPGGKELVSQLRDVPSGQWDDGPDACAGLLRRVQTLLR